MTGKATTPGMPILKRKRLDTDCEVTDVQPVKKPKKSAPEQDNTTLFQVSVAVHPRFNEFPQPLRAILQSRFQTALSTHITSLKGGTLPLHHQTYSIITGKRTGKRSGSDYDTTVAIPNTIGLGVANMTLLDFFLKKTKLELKADMFVKLKTQKDTLNPDFVDLHAVRHGELGSGFDAEGCLGLYAAGIEEVWYVRNGGIKLEGEA
jgi:hypothetical protein